MLTLAAMLTDTARRDPRRTAVIDGERVVSYGELDAAARRVAAFLVARGVGPGDRVAVMLPNVVEFPVVYFGVLRAGAVVVPVNTMLTRAEVAYHLVDSGAAAFVVGADVADPEAWRGYEDADGCSVMVTVGDRPGPGVRLADVLAGPLPEDVSVPTEPTDTAVVLYTSGTTGRPKGAELTHANMVVNALVHTRLLESRADDVHLATLPLFHSFGQTVQMNAGFAVGATLVLLSRFTATAALDLIARHGVTVFAGVPTMYWALLDAAERDGVAVDLARILRVAVSGGAALPVDVLERFHAVFGVAVREGYGLSETSPTVTLTPLDGPQRPGSIGLPIWGVEVRLVDERGDEVGPGLAGELTVRGHNVMKGYLGRPEATAEAIRDGWFHTGDIARRDEDGYLYIVDRLKDLIVRSGFNVYPREVEETLTSHPEVGLAAVVGVPDPRVGEEVAAFVVRTPGSTLTEQDLVAWCRARLASYKCPRLVEFREVLPTTATGKVQKRALR